MNKTYEKYIDEYKKDIIRGYFYGKNELLNKLYGFEDRGEFTIQVLDELLDLEKENQQLKEKLNCKEYFSSTMPEDTEFVILTKNNYDRQQKDLALENIQLKKQKDDVVECCNKSIKSINEKLEKNKEPFEVVDGKIICLNDYQVVRLKAIRMKCKEILRMLGETDE